MFFKKRKKVKKFDKKNNKEYFEYPEFNVNLDNVFNNIEYILYTWKQNDNYFKISNKFYNTPSYWKHIAILNKLPNEFEIPVGTQIKIPKQIQEVINLFD